MAYKVYKELERIIRGLNMKLRVDKVLAIAKTITTLRIRLPNGSTYTETLYTTPQQESLKPLLEALARYARDAHLGDALSKSGNPADRVG